MESTPGETFLIVGTKLDLSEKFLDFSVVFVVFVCLFKLCGGLGANYKRLNECPC